MSSLIAAIEIGTTRTVLAVGELVQTGTGRRLHVLGTAETPSTGVRKSLITDVSQATHAVESVLKKIEQTASTNVNVAQLVVNGPQIQSSLSTGLCRPAGKNITENDVFAVREKAEAVAQTDVDDTQREILHLFGIDFTVNDQEGIVNPVNMSGQRLSHRVLAVHASKDCVTNSCTAAGDAKLEITAPVFSGYAAALSTITQREMHEGVLVLDLGGGTTSYTAYCEGNYADAGVVGVGGDHVTNDIAMAFNCSNGQAESIKCAYGSATVDPAQADKRVPIPATMAGAEERTIAMRSLNTVINVRMTELFKIVLSRLEESGLLHRLGAGVVLTGGGAYLRNVAPLASRVLGLNVRIGIPANVDGLEEVHNPASYATIAGALLCGAENEQNEHSAIDRIHGILKRIFS